MEQMYGLNRHRQNFIHIQMVVVTNCETLNIKDKWIFRFFFFKMMYKYVVLLGFWQLVRHWNESCCKMGTSKCSR